MRTHVEEYAGMLVQHAAVVVVLPLFISSWP